MKIKVMKKHIKAGIKDNMISCPVALALREQTDLSDIKVYGPFITWEDSRRPSSGRHRRRASRSVTRFVNRFDKIGKVKPFNFILDTKES